MFDLPIHKITKTITINHVYKLPFHHVPKLAKDLSCVTSCTDSLYVHCIVTFVGKF